MERGRQAERESVGEFFCRDMTVHCICIVFCLFLDFRGSDICEGVVGARCLISYT